MKNLENYGRQCIKDLNAIGIYPNDIEKFTVNTRAKTRWGQAVRKGGLYYININSMLLQDDCPEKALLETLYHELLHCVNDCMNHGKQWQDLADIVNDCYNVSVTRCSTDEKKLGDYAKTIKNVRENSVKKFKVECRNCGNSTIRFGMRKPKWYVHPDWYTCTLCGGTLKKSC